METLVELPANPEIGGWISEYVDGDWVESIWGRPTLEVHPYCRGFPMKRPLWYIKVTDIGGKRLEGYIADFITVKMEQLDNLQVEPSPLEPTIELIMGGRGGVTIQFYIQRTLPNRFKYWLFSRFFPFEVNWLKIDGLFSAKET